ncbi:MAG: chloramphenicol acetyltransferase [Bacteroidales bacterium]|nr:chloramphenicol acetyltransferase [Bacteroidales bacterium]
MVEKVNPKETTRAEAYELWMTAPQPMVTLTTTLNVRRLWRYARKHNVKLNMLLCWCIGKAASQVPEFSLLPIGKELIRYDQLAVNIIVQNVKGGINTCDIPFSDNISTFNADYMRLTEQCSTRCEHYDISKQAMIIGTSALVEVEIDSATGMYSGIYNNPFCFWGKARCKWFSRTLPFSFQFHHTQMDGLHAAKFLKLLQDEIYKLR